MNCIDLRRLVPIDPARIDPEALAHAARCRSCNDFIEATRATEKLLAATLNVPVPEGLARRAVQRAVQRQGISRRYALAAGLALALGTGVIAYRAKDDPRALAGIDFVVYEEAGAILGAKPADPRDLALVAARIGIRLPVNSDDMRYVGTCPFDGGIAHHVVMKTSFGKVTLLLVPGRTIGSRVVAAAHGLEAVVAPARGGCVVIVADSTRSLTRVESSLYPA